MMFGVSKESKAYRLYDPETKKIIISRDVRFDERHPWDWEKKEEYNTTLDVFGEEEQPTNANNPETE